MRNTIQEELNKLQDIECGEPISDDIVEEDKTYFGYQINSTYKDSDMDKNYTYRVSITGYIERRIKEEENTIEIVDNGTEEILEILKNLNFKCNTEDVSIENNIKKIKITGYTEYNEINKKFII